MNLKHKLPIWVMGALVIVGVLDECFFWDPIHRKAFIYQGLFGIVPAIFLDVPIVIGWLYLMFGKDQLKPRLQWFWTPFGLLLFAWAWLTLYGTTVLEEARAITIGTLITYSPELWRSSAIGLLFAFYVLESAKPLWYFYWSWFLAGATMYSGEFITRVFLGGPVPWSPYLLGGPFWHNWGFFFLDLYAVPLAIVAGYFIIKWRIGVLEKEGERHPRFWGFWQGIGLPFALLGRGLKKAFRK